MNPLMDILRQQQASRRPGYRYGSSVHGGGMGTADSSGSSTSGTQNSGGWGPGVGQDQPGTGDYAGAQGLGINSSTNQGNPHLSVPDNVPSVDPDPDRDDSPEKNQWWSKFTKNIREDVTNFFTPANLQRGLFGLITSMINPAGAIGLNGLVAMAVNAGLVNSMVAPTQSEVAQGEVDEAQANMDIAHDAGTEQAMNDAMASLSAAQASEAAAAAAAAEAADDQHGEGRPQSDYYLANNPYQQNPYSSTSYQGGMDPPPDYSQYVLSHDEQSMADGLEAIGYAPHTAIQYAMHYYNNVEAPAYT